MTTSCVILGRQYNDAATTKNITAPRVC